MNTWSKENDPYVEGTTRLFLERPLSKGYTLRVMVEDLDTEMNVCIYAYSGEWFETRTYLEGRAKGPGGLEVYQEMQRLLPEAVTAGFEVFPHLDMCCAHGATPDLTRIYKRFFRGTAFRYDPHHDEFYVFRGDWMDWRNNA